MSQRSLQPIAEVLMSLFEKGKSPVSQSYQISKIWTYWHDWLPSSISGATQPLALNRGTLYILVKSSSWLYELNFNKEALLSKLQEQVGTEVLTTIQLTLDARGLPDDVLKRPELKEFFRKNSQELKNK
jgi:predicted nucleic acid-binding Zn ribbon protein